MPDGSASTIEVTWADNPFSGGSAVLGYHLQHNSGYSSSFIEPGVDIAHGTNTYTLTGLLAGATYAFRIAAYNVLEAANTFPDDALNFSDPVYVIAANEPTQITVFEQPTTDYESGTVRLSWEAPNNSGSEILRYIVTRDVGSGVHYVVYEGIDLNYTDTELQPGETYLYKVRAENARGEGPESAVLTTTASQIPGKIDSVSIKLQSRTALTIEWEAPVITGDLPFLRYLVRTDEADYALGSAIDNSLDLEYTKAIAAAGEGKIFRFRVAVENALGIGEYSDEI